MKTALAALYLCASMLCTGALADPIPSPVLLWPGGAPGATGDSNEDKPAIYPFLSAQEHATGAAMLVVPGGGFQTRVVDHEGTLIAHWLQEHGVSAFVLRYRIRPIGTTADSVVDAQRALRFLRAHASEYKISPDRIGTIGFSAGSELLNVAAGKPAPAVADAPDPVERFAGDMNWMVLAYGSTNSVAADAYANFPATFLFCTVEDASHLNGMLTLFTNLRRARVPVEAHWFADGEHGVGFAQGDPVLGAWPDLMFNWMRSRGYLTERQRVAISGMAMVDGQPLPRGIVTFIPIDSAGPPAIPAYVFNTGPVRGQFEVPASRGLVPGKYRVEIHEYALRWMSNSREPFIIAYNAKGRNATEQDRQDYLKFARERNLEPSLDGERVYSKAHPNDSEPIILEIKPDGVKDLKIEVFSK
jgi:acetyl esterase/lipase